MAISENVARDVAAGAILPSRSRISHERRYTDRGRPLGIAAPQAGFPAEGGPALFLAALEATAIVISSLIAGIAYSFLSLHYAGDTKFFFGNGILVAALFCCAARARDAHRVARAVMDTDELHSLFAVWLAVFSFVGSLWFFLRLDPTHSRGAFLSFFALGFIAVGVIQNRAPQLIAAWYHPRRFAGHSIVLVGARGGMALEKLKAELGFTGCAAPLTVDITAACDQESWPKTLATAVRDIRAHTREASCEQICVAAEGIPPSRLADLLTALQSIPNAIRLVPEATAESYLHLPARALGRLRAVEIQRAPLTNMQRVFKRLIDLAIAIPFLFLATPTMLAIAIAVRIDSRGPILFRQRRLGYRGKPFDIYKFRTMNVMENGTDIAQARKGDSRITRLGLFLRSASLDELPQLFNVIRGDMSLVGPRPHAVAHDSYFASLIENYELRQHVMPGVTGWAQVHGLRGETATPAMMRMRVEFDLWYAKNASLLLDFQILARTAIAVFRQRNAY